jgi:hypothetical protein
VSDTSAGARAVAACEIADVFIIESRCHVVRDFNPMDTITTVTFQHRIAPQKEAIAQTRQVVASGEEINIVRYYIEGGLRVLKPAIADEKRNDQALTKDDILAEITATLAVDYTCPKSYLEDTEAIGAFGRNAVFHAWPYWRQIIHALSDQMRLPRITLPMMKQGASLHAPTAHSETVVGRNPEK